MSLPARYLDDNIVLVEIQHRLRQNDRLMLACDDNENAFEVGRVVEFNDEYKTRGIITRQVPFEEYAVWAHQVMPNIRPQQLYPKAFEVFCD